MKYVNTGILITLENQGTTLLLVDQTNCITQSVLMQKTRDQLQAVGSDQFQDMVHYSHYYQEEYLYQEYFQTIASLG